MVLATRGRPALPFARVPVNGIWAAKRALDAGVSGIIFPFTSTGELARQAVAACRYPPLGRRGSGAGLATFTWPGEVEGRTFSRFSCSVSCSWMADWPGEPQPRAVR